MFSELTGLSLPALIEAAGYFGLFLIVFAESGVPIGFIFPGDSLLFVAGLLASQGIFSIVPLLCITTSAAIIGDSVGYATGAYAGPKLFSGTGFFFNERTVTRTQAFYEKYGASALILARFVPAVRTFVPIFAGVARMRYRTFLTYNVVGGVLWGTGVTTLGYLLGNTFPGIEHYVLPVAVGIIALSALPVAIELYQAFNAKRRKT